jgi:hypothetical protein
VTSTYLFPFKEDLIRFDFEVGSEDEYICHFKPKEGEGMVKGIHTPPTQVVHDFMGTLVEVPQQEKYHGKPNGLWTPTNNERE